MEMIDLIIILVISGLVMLALKRVLKDHAAGGCSGCSGCCHGCSRCTDAVQTGARHKSSTN